MVKYLSNIYNISITMKKIINKIYEWFLIWIWAVIAIALFWLVAVNANIISWWWSSSWDSWINIDSNPNNIYTTANNQLTSAKWNALVQRTKWEDVTDTSLFDIECQRRIVDWNNMTILPSYMNSSDIYTLYSWTLYWDVKYTDKTKFQTYPWTQTIAISKVQKMCNK